MRAHKLPSSLYIGLAVLAIAIALTGCSKPSGDPDAAAEVNGHKILNSEVDRAYYAQIADAPQKPSGLEEEALRLNIVTQLIEQQIMLQRAETIGVFVSGDDVDTKVRETKAPYTKEEFQRKLSDMGLTEKQFALELRHSMTLTKLTEKEVTAKVQVSDLDIKAYYDQNKNEFNIAEPRYRIARIYVSNQRRYLPGLPMSPAQLNAAAKRQIQLAHDRLDSQEDFTTVAEKYSQDVAAGDTPGAVQQLPESQIRALPPVIRDAVLKLKPGEYSGVLPAFGPGTGQPVGYQIIKLDGKIAVGQRELSEPPVQEFIRKKLRSQLEQLLKAAYDEDLRDHAVVHNYYAAQVLKKHASK